MKILDLALDLLEATAGLCEWVWGKLTGDQ